MSVTNRRTFLQTLAVLAAANPWDEAAAILKRIRPPSFPNRDFDITRYGASGDGTRDSTEAIRARDRGLQPGRRRPRDRSGGTVSHRRNPPEEQREPPRQRGRDTALRSRPAQVSPRGLHPLGGRRVHELLAVHLRLRAGEHRHHRRRNLGRAGGLRALVALEGADRVRVEEGRPQPGEGAEPAFQDGGRRRAARRSGSSARAACCARSSSSRTARKNVLIEGVSIRQLAHVGTSPGPVPERHRPRREDFQPRAEQRRLRSGIVHATC